MHIYTTPTHLDLGSLAEPGAHRFVSNSYPAISKDAPIAAFPTLGSQGHATTSGFLSRYLGF